MKNSLNPFKWPLVWLLPGIMVRVAGAIMKILNLLNEDNILIAGTEIMVVSFSWLIIQIVFLKQQNS